MKFCKITRTPYWVPKYSEEVIAVGDGSFEIDFDEDNVSNTDGFSRPFYDVNGSTIIYLNARTAFECTPVGHGLYIPFAENDSFNESFEDHMIDSVTGNPESKAKKRRKKDSDWCESEDEYTGGLSAKKKKTQYGVRKSKVKDPTLHLTMRERSEAKNLSEEKIALILKCCDICNPNNQEYQNVITQIPTPKTFDYGAYIFDSYGVYNMLSFTYYVYSIYYT